MSKQLYMISLHGCDDSTSFPVRLTDKEAQLITNIAEQSQKTSTYQCMPTMSIEKYNEEPK